MPALVSLDMCLSQQDSFGATGTSSMAARLTQLSLSGEVPGAAAMLAAAAPALRSLQLRLGQRALAAGQLAAAVCRLRALTMLKCDNRAVLPLLPAGAPEL